MGFYDGFSSRGVDSITGSDGQVLTKIAGQWTAADAPGATGGISSVTLHPSETNLTGAGTIANPLYLKQDVHFSTVTSSYVTASDVITDYVNFTGLSADPVSDNGRVWYNNIAHELDYWTEVPTVKVTLGQQLVQRCWNQSGAPLTKGTVVHISSSNPNSTDTPRIVVADWTNDSLSANTLGLVAETIANDAAGYVIVQGILKGINTDSYNPGQILYLSSSGTITNIKPVAPKHMVVVGQVVRKQLNNGSIYVSIQNGYELEELHDVLINGRTDGDLISWSSTTPAWKNTKQLSGSYGLTGSLRLNGDIRYPYTTKTVNYTASTQTDYYVAFSGNTLTGTLPTAVGNGGREFVFKNLDTSSLFITSSVSTIDGSTSGVTISSQYGHYRFISDNTNWFII